MHNITGLHNTTFETGPKYFTQQVLDFNKNNDNKITLFTPHIFYPYNYTQNKPLTYEKVTYAAHHWGKSWWHELELDLKLT